MECDLIAVLGSFEQFVNLRLVTLDKTEPLTRDRKIFFEKKREIVKKLLLMVTNNTTVTYDIHKRIQTRCISFNGVKSKLQSAAK